jgi:hypothetical protein
LNEAFLIAAPLVTLVDSSIENASLAAFPIFAGKVAQKFLFVLFRFLLPSFAISLLKLRG